MLPTNLKPEQFAGYPPKARELAVSKLTTLQRLPLSFLPNLLREIIEYDYKFPAERTAIDKELDNLSSLTPEQSKEWLKAFSAFSLPRSLQDFDWVNQPAQFVEQLSAYLWTTHQQDAFREAALAYGERSRTSPEPPAIPRLGIAVIGQGVTSYNAQLFRKLRPHGTWFGQIQPENGIESLLAGATARAKAHPVPYGHWYVDGGAAADHSTLLTSVSFQKLEPLRAALLKNMEAEIARPGMGPEELRTHMARLSPADLGMSKSGDEVLDRFQLKLFTEGSGTQIFSTTFAQWTAREVLRRAQAVTLMVRFAPRQRARQMNELLLGKGNNAEPDFTGSLIDADMAAYYQWINQQRLPGAERSGFVAWFEGHNQALVIGPSLPRNTESSSRLNLGELLSLATT